MAYENGRRINRYAAKMIGIDKQKARQKSGIYYWNDLENNYWRWAYMTGKRTYAKRSTNRAVRRIGMDTPNYSGYRKAFDYHHVLW